MKKFHEEFGRANCISLDDLKYSTVQLAYKSKETADAKTREVTKYFYTRVPRFLVNAFTFLHERKYLSTEGIFRKQGNSSKIKGSVTEYFQGNKIDDDLSVFDVCVVIKRFITSIKGGLFGDKEDKIVDSAFDQNGKATPITLCHFCHTLPEHNFGILAYLIFQMAQVVTHSKINKMSVENLATILVPGMFQSFNRGITKNDIGGIKRHQETLKQIVVMIIVHQSDLLTPRKMLRNNSIPRRQIAKIGQTLQDSLKEMVTPTDVPKAIPRSASRMTPIRRASFPDQKKTISVATPIYIHAAVPMTPRSKTPFLNRVDTIYDRRPKTPFRFTSLHPELKSAHN